jgi:hypothetical protein
MIVIKEELKEESRNDNFYSFEQTINTPELSENFVQFLKKEHNENLINFINDVDTLLMIENPKEKEKKIKYIMDEYIFNNSKNEINLTEKQKRRVLEYYNLDGLDEKIFSEAYQATIRLLKNDSFFRYTSSPSSNNTSFNVPEQETFKPKRIENIRVSEKELIFDDEETEVERVYSKEELSSFEFTMNNKELLSRFTQFLKKEYNLNSINFVLDVYELSKTEQMSVKEKKIKEVINEYINSSSQNEVNLREKTKRKIYESHKIDKYDEKIFLDSYNEILRLLKNDSFFRYIKEMNQDEINYKMNENVNVKENVNGKENVKENRNRKENVNVKNNQEEEKINEIIETNEIKENKEIKKEEEIKYKINIENIQENEEKKEKINFEQIFINKEINEKFELFLKYHTKKEYLIYFQYLMEYKDLSKKEYNLELLNVDDIKDELKSLEGNF